MKHKWRNWFKVAIRCDAAERRATDSHPDRFNVAATALRAAQRRPHAPLAVALAWTMGLEGIALVALGNIHGPALLAGVVVAAVWTAAVMREQEPVRRVVVHADVADCERRDQLFLEQDVNAWTSLACLAVGLVVAVAVVRRRLSPPTPRSPW